MPSPADTGTATGAPTRSVTVGAHVVLDVGEPSALAVQVVAANDPGSFTATLDGVPVPVRAVTGPEPWARQHIVECGPGTLRLDYDATVRPGSGAVSVVDEAERLLMQRPSRYCPADRLGAYGATRLPGPERPALERVRAITDYVHGHLAYVSGSTGPTDDAVDVLLAGQGVCRDYAHVVVTLARAAGLAARLVAVYAPGLYPMDFHAVDATRLAPRASLVRIATGRDAADTAWLTTLRGRADLLDVTVSAVADDGLPWDDGDSPTTLT